MTTRRRARADHLKSRTYWVKEVSPSQLRPRPEHLPRDGMAGQTAAVNGRHRRGDGEVRPGRHARREGGRGPRRTAAGRREPRGRGVHRRPSTRALPDGQLRRRPGGGPARVLRTDADGFCYSGGRLQGQRPGASTTRERDDPDPPRHRGDQRDEGARSNVLDDGAGNDPKKFCVQITYDGAMGASVYPFNTPTQPIQSNAATSRLVKEVPICLQRRRQPAGGWAHVLAEGASRTRSSTTTRRRGLPGDRREVARGGVVCTITVDENGLADHQGDRGCPTDGPGPWPAGTCTVHEIVPAETTWRRPSRPSTAKDLSCCPTGRRRYPPRASTTRPRS